MAKSSLNIRLPKTSKLLAVEAEAQSQGFVYRYVLLKRSGQKISISKSGDGLESLEALKKEAGSNAPVALVVNGRKVLYKALDGKITESGTLLQSVLPNASLNDFFLQYTLGPSRTFVAVIRQEHLDELLKEFAEHSFLIQQINLGPFVLGQLQILKGKEQSWTVGRYLLSFQEEGLTQLSTSKEAAATPALKAGDETVQPEVLMAFAAGFSTWAASMDFTTIDSEEANRQVAELRQRNIFRLAGAAFLSVLFVVLLANYVLHGAYSDQLNDLQAQESIHRTQLDQIDQLETDLERKNALLEASGVLSGGSLAYYSDQLAASLPEEIKLTQLSIAVPTDDVKKDERISYAPKQVTITGETDFGATLNGWLNDLNTEDWITAANLETYNIDDRRGVGVFTVNLTLP